MFTLLIGVLDLEWCCLVLGSSVCVILVWYRMFLLWFNLLVGCGFGLLGFSV